MSDTLRHQLATFSAVHASRGVYKPSTLKNYKSYLTGFVDSLPCDAGADQFTLSILHAYVDAFRADPSRSTAVLIQLLYALRAFGNHLKRRGLITANPAIDIEVPRRDPPTRYLMAPNEPFQLLAACERLPPRYNRALATAVLHVLIHAGVRRSELLNFRVEDYDPAARTLAVLKSKNDKSRYIYIPVATAAALDAWLRVRPADCRHDYLFAISARQRMAHGTVMAILEACCDLVGVEWDKRFRCHSFRHAYCTRLLDGGADARSVADQVGHTSAATTMDIYQHPPISHLQKIAELSVTAGITPPESKPLSPAPTAADSPQPDRRSAAWRQKQIRRD